MIEESPPLLTIKEAAERLRRDRSTVRRWIRAGDLPVVRMNGRNYVPRAAIERWDKGES